MSRAHTSPSGPTVNPPRLSSPVAKEVTCPLKLTRAMPPVPNAKLVSE